MEPRHLYTIRWTQPYSTYQMRHYLRHLRDEYERVIEDKLARNEFDDAKHEIKRIMQL
jgi:enolase